MEQSTIYYITEAAKLVHVEPHVLRYWEDELKLPIKRNEMGHRCYTGKDIRQLQEIKSLKEQGLQLKAIRTILPKQEEGEEQSVMNGVHKYMVMLSKDRNDTAEKDEATKKEAVREETEHREAMSSAIVVEEKTELAEKPDDKAQKAARLQYLLQNMITQAVKTANRELCTDVKESILKELDYQFRMQEERDEEHYRKIDEMIRQRHKPKEKSEKARKKPPILG